MNSPSKAVMTSMTKPANATIPASLPTDSPDARMTMTSLFAASAPKPSREPISAETGNIWKARFGSLSAA